MSSQRLKESRLCEFCHSSFFPFRNSKGVFCSNQCKFKARKSPVILTCQHCNISFEKYNHKDAKYCSHSCYLDAKTSRSVIERLEPYIEKTDTCWLWTGGINAMGYGRVHFQGKAWLAHRLMYHTVVEPLTDTDLVRHYVCDNPPCVNPDHLLKGNHSDNMQDAKRSGRHAHGETSYAKLTETEVVAIWHDTRTHQAIADAYNVNRRTVGHIKLGTTWTHLNLGRCSFRRYKGQS